MPAWTEARRLSTAMSSNAAKKEGGVDDFSAEMLRSWFKFVYKNYNPETHRCLFNGKNCSGKTTTGYVNGFGTVWKCRAHTQDYEEIRSVFG